MNRDEAFISQLEDYLEDLDGVTPLPDRVRVAVSAELPRTPQVRPAGFPRRMLNMTSRISAPARLGLAAAALVVAVVAGAALINNDSQAPAVGSAPSTPSPTAAATPTTTPPPSATATPTDTPAPEVSAATGEVCGQSWSRCLVPGAYSLSVADGYPERINFNVPAGWWWWYGGSGWNAILVHNDEAPRASGWGVVFSTVDSVSLDPCRPDQGSLDAASTASVDALVAVMQGWPGFQASDPKDIVVDGFAGAFIELSTDLDDSDCPDPVFWTTPGGFNYTSNPLVNPPATGPRPAQYRVFDINGSILVIMTTDFPETSPLEIEMGVSPDPTLHAGDQAELRAIVDSIRLTPEAEG